MRSTLAEAVSFKKERTILKGGVNPSRTSQAVWKERGKLQVQDSRWDGRSHKEMRWETDDVGTTVNVYPLRPGIKQ